MFSITWFDLSLGLNHCQVIELLSNIASKIHLCTHSCASQWDSDKNDIQELSPVLNKLIFIEQNMIGKYAKDV